MLSERVEGNQLAFKVFFPSYYEELIGKGSELRTSMSS